MEVSRRPELASEQVRGVGNFINVSPLVINTANHPGLDVCWSGDVVLMWGSGDYRKSDVFLASAPLNALKSGPAKSYWAYYTGDPGPYTWVWAGSETKPDEAQAKPLLGEGGVGEFSITCALRRGLAHWPP